jgi:predicted ester cyclase
MASEQERNKALVLQLYDEVWNKGNLSYVNVAVAPNFVDHPSRSPFPLPTEGTQAISELATRLRSAMPDLHDQVIQVVAEGDRVSYLGRITGGHTGAFFQIQPSGKRVSITAIHHYRLKDGKIVERCGGYDIAGLMMQMGAVPGGAH